LVARILFLALACAAVSCVPIDGGAVEASWVVRSKEGRAIGDCGCADPAIASVRITLVGERPAAVMGTRPCDGRNDCLFSCARHTGATPFDIPPGSYLISLTPVGVSGEDLPADETGVLRPAAITRDVVRGQPTQLDAFQLVAACAPNCSGANKNEVCSRP
jgi:hypothetical protein